jgi:hypothetical protein
MSGCVGFVVDRVALGQVFSEYLGFGCQFSFHQLLHTNRSSGAGTMGPIMAFVLNELSYLAHTMKIEANHEDVSQDNLCPSRDSNPAPQNTSLQGCRYSSQLFKNSLDFSFWVAFNINLSQNLSPRINYICIKQEVYNPPRIPGAQNMSLLGHGIKFHEKREFSVLQYPFCFVFTLISIFTWRRYVSLGIVSSAWTD